MGVSSLTLSFATEMKCNFPFNPSLFSHVLTSCPAYNLRQVLKNKARNYIYIYKIQNHLASSFLLIFIAQKCSVIHTFASADLISCCCHTPAAVTAVACICGAHSCCLTEQVDIAWEIEKDGLNGNCSSSLLT